jgi:beta-mannanase
MRSLLSIIGLFMAVSTLLTPAVASAATISPGPSVYWGAKIPGAPFDMTKIDTFESHAGKKMSITSWGQAWMNHGQFQSFQTSTFQAARNRGLMPLLTWGSWDLANKGVNEPNFQLADITSGKYDAHITAWAKQAKAWGHPFFLRFDWEMNGWWYPWSEQVNGNHPGDFVRMWRHVHDIFTRVGANNVTWVWCPNIVGRNSTPMSGMYPGASYVDWTCFDGYNWGDLKGGWQTFPQVMTGSAQNTGGHDTYHNLLAVAADKPIMIAETASTEHGGNKAAWIANMLKQLPIQYPKVKALVYNDVFESPGSDWPIETSAAARSAFKAGIASPEYATSHFATIVGKIKALP